MPEPLNKSLYKRVKQMADSRFKSKTGIYKSSWIVKEYKRLGGKYSGKKPSVKSPGLKRWYKEKWVDLNRPIENSKGKTIGYKSCGRSSANKGKYPLCRPSRKVTRGTPKTYKQLSKTSLNRAKREKRRIRGSGNIKFGGMDNDNTEILEQIIDNLFSSSDKIYDKNEKTVVYKCEDCEYKSKDYISVYRHKLSDHIGIDMDRADKLFRKTFSGPEYEWLYSDSDKTNNEKSSKKSNDKDIKEKSNIEKLSVSDDFVKKRKYDLMNGGAQYYGKRSSTMITVPENVKKVALYSYKIKRLGFRGGLETGWKRANQLSTQSAISIQDLKYMRAWFARHIITSYPTYKRWMKAGRPKDSSWHNKRGIIAWLIWGGDSAFRWVNSQKNINLLNKHYNKSYKPLSLK
jgi:hypothetical protein